MSSALDTATRAKEVANAAHSAARKRSQFAAAARAYLSAAQPLGECTEAPAEAERLRAILMSNAAESLIRAGDYVAAQRFARHAVESGMLGNDQCAKAKRRVARAEAGQRLLGGNLGRATSGDAPIPDCWFEDPTSDLSAGISRLCWGWRSDLETAVRQSDAAAVEEIISSHGFAEINTFAECSLLLDKACCRGALPVVELLVEEAGCDIDGRHSGCPRAIAAIRASRGYNHCTPLYGAAQGDPGVPLAARAKVARYLLEHGADPMLASDGGPTPLFIAAVNNALPIVKLMLDSKRCDVLLPLKDGETPLSVVRSCVGDKSGGPEGFTEYRPLLALLEAAASCGSSGGGGGGGRAARADSPHARAVLKKGLANDAFGAGEYANAQTLYRQALACLDEEADEVALPTKTDDAALRVTLLSNRSEALLRLGCCFKAARACEAALEIDPLHAKSRGREARAEAAIASYEKIVRQFDATMASFMEATTAQVAGASQDFAAGATLAAKLVAVGARLDPFHHVLGLLSEAEALYYDGRERTRDFARASAAAHQALSLCHDYEKRSVEIDLTELDSRKASGRLHVKAASAWLILGRIDNEASGDLAQTDTKLREALAEYSAADQDLGESHIEPYVGKMHTWCEMVDVAGKGAQWGVASTTASKMLEEVVNLAEEHFADGRDQGRDQGSSTFQMVHSLLTTAAASLDRGGAATRALMVRMYREAARRHAALGDDRQTALTWRKLLNSRRVSWGSPQDMKPPDDTEAAAVRSDLESLFAALRRMGRDDCTTCSICLGEMVSETGPPVDVLECLHVFHGACARRGIFECDAARVSAERARPRHPDEKLILTGACPLCRAEVSMCGVIREPQVLAVD